MRKTFSLKSRFTNYPIFRQIIKFECTEDGILRTADIMRVRRELHNSGISIDNIKDYEIQIGNTLFPGTEFRKLLTEARSKGGLLKVDVDFSFRTKDPISDRLSLLYQWYPRAWVTGFFGSHIVDYSQSFVDVSLVSLGVYMVASTLGSVLLVTPKNTKNRYFRLFMYLPSLDAISNTKDFNFIKRNRAKVAIDNIVVAAERVPDWKNILIVAEDPLQEGFIRQELDNRFNN